MQKRCLYEHFTQYFRFNDPILEHIPEISVEAENIKSV